MNSIKQPQITFVQVNTPQAKLEWITSTVQQQFELGRRILIVAPNDEASRFVDQLLWKFQPEAFIPHAIIHQSATDIVAITTRHQNLNRAHVLINLCPDASPIAADFDYIFEMHDNTHPSKAQLSQQRQAFYQVAGHNTIIR